MRNPEFGVGHLEKWAEMLQILKDIAGNRMPSVADLLKEAAQAPCRGRGRAQQPTQDGRASPGRRIVGAEARPTAEESRRRPFPQVVDREIVRSNRRTTRPGKQPPKSKARDAAAHAARRRPSPVRPAQPARREAPAGEKVDEAVKEQQDLLAEFDKIADELNRVLANLEGSTLLKRLKAASRSAVPRSRGRISDQVSAAFGVAGHRPGADAGEAPRARCRSRRPRAATTSR